MKQGSINTKKRKYCLKRFDTLLANPNLTAQKIIIILDEELHRLEIFGKIRNFRLEVPCSVRKTHNQANVSYNCSNLKIFQNVNKYTAIAVVSVEKKLKMYSPRISKYSRSAIQQFSIVFLRF